MKYEAVFGDQSLFDGAPEDATHATKGGGFYRATESGAVQYLSSGSLNGDMCKYLHGYLVAERRIIEEPKRWTVEDKKAGMLPEVGSIGLTDYGRAEYLGNDVISVNKCHVRYEADGYCERIAIKKFTPIESPEEKAARLRSEWCIKALSSCSILSEMQKYELKRLGGYIEDIYDALLSGDLPVPVKE